MKNTVVDQFLSDCEDELSQLEASMNLFGHTSSLGMFLTRYAIIKACGTIERAFKALVADYAEESQSQQIKNYLTNQIRDSSMNPNESNISKLLKSFDEKWASAFSEKLNSLPDQARKKQSLKSLIQARNVFAHGGSPTTTIAQIKIYYCDSRAIMNIIDEVVV